MAAITRLAYRERAQVARPEGAPRKGTLELLWRDIKRRAKDIAEAPGKLSSTELAERAAGVFGAGMLKPLATGRALIQATKYYGGRGLYGRGVGKEYTPMIQEMLETPQREFSRLKHFDVARMEPHIQLGGARPTGLYDPRRLKATVSPELMVEPRYRKRIFRHEVRGHARETRPEPITAEMRQTQRLTAVNDLLRDFSTPEDFYRFSPAEAVARKMESFPKMSSEKYTQLLGKEISKAEVIARKQLLDFGYGHNFETVLKDYIQNIYSRGPGPARVYSRMRGLGE